MKYTWPILLFVCVLTACRKSEITYEQVIQNDSNHDLWMKIHSYGTDTIDSTQFSMISYVVDSVFIPRNSSVVLFGRSGVSLDQFSPCKTYQDSISTIVSDSTILQLILDPAQDTNYVFNDLGGNKKKKACECRMIIKNIHFQ